MVKIALMTLFFPLYCLAQTQVVDTQKSENLTDQDKYTSENYIHGLKIDRIYNEECAKDSESKDACIGNEPETDLLGLDGNMVEALSKAYTLIMGVGGVGSKLDPEVKNAAAKPEASPDTEEISKSSVPKDEEPEALEDYCRYIPVATESIALMRQNSDTGFIEALPGKMENEQLNQLYKSKDMHISRSKTAKIQKIGWSSTSVCYAAYMSIPGLASATSWKNGAKLAASTLLAYYYSKKEKDHRTYADKVQGIIDKMPGKGDCNPVTDKICYCSEETSMYDDLCIGRASQTAIAATSLETGCVNDQLKADPNCDCTKTNSCFDKKLISNLTLSGIPPQFIKSNLNPFLKATQGELVGGKLQSGGDGLFAQANNKLRELEKNIDFPNSNLNETQKKQATLLASSGLGPRSAANLASLPVNKSVTDNLEKFKGADLGGKYSYASKSNSANRIIEYTSTHSERESSASSNRFENPFKDILKKKEKNSKNRILSSYIEKAVGEAQINNNKDVNLFDIITRRYRVSGWEKVELFE